MWFPAAGIMVSTYRNGGFLFFGTAVSKTPDTGVIETGILIVIRINFLKVVGVTLDKAAIDYVLLAINDWIIFENDIDEECTTHYYQMRQMLKKSGITMR